MHLLPPQVELDVTCLILTLATLAIAWLTCSLPTRDAGRLKTPNAALRSRAAGPPPTERTRRTERVQPSIRFDPLSLPFCVYPKCYHGSH